MVTDFQNPSKAKKCCHHKGIACKDTIFLDENGVVYKNVCENIDFSMVRKRNQPLMQQEKNIVRTNDDAEQKHEAKWTENPSLNNNPIMRILLP